MGVKISGICVTYVLTPPIPVVILPLIAVNSEIYISYNLLHFSELCMLRLYAPRLYK